MEILVLQTHMKKLNVVIIFFLLLSCLENIKTKYERRKSLKWGAINLQVMCSVFQKFWSVMVLLCKGLQEISESPTYIFWNLRYIPKTVKIHSPKSSTIPIAVVKLDVKNSFGCNKDVERMGKALRTIQTYYK